MAEKQLPRVPPYYQTQPVLLRDLRDEKDPDFYKSTSPQQWFPDSPPGRRPTRTMTSTTFSEGRSVYSRQKDYDVLPPRPGKVRVCGLRRPAFYTVLAISLLLVIGVVVGLTVGMTMGKKGGFEKAEYQFQQPVPVPPSQIPNAELLRGDPRIGTTLATVSYLVTTEDPMPDQSFRLYYQDHEGKIRQMEFEPARKAWQNSTVIAEDAKEESGLAAFTLLNRAEQNHFIIYVDQNDQLRGKRKAPFNSAWEELESLNSGKYKVGRPSQGEIDSATLRVAAVSSLNFGSGPGARVFYHASSDKANEDGFVQELLWDQQKDSWSQGARIQGSAPTSQLATALDDKVLRLFYCAGDGTLQESWTNVAGGNGSYAKGFSKLKALDQDDSPLSAVAVAGSTLVYYSEEHEGIRELNITGSPGSPDRPETAVLNPKLVVTVAEQDVLSIGAVASLPVSGGADKPSIHIFYRDTTMSVDTDEAVPVLETLERSVSDRAWPEVAPWDTSNRLPI